MDSNNCGACGTVCEAGEVCSDGECALSCGPGLTDCDGVCRDLEVDRNNCGACGTECEAGEVCFEGECAVSCGEGLTDCDGVCRDLQNDNRNCGVCGEACGAGEVCIEGECEVVCPEGSELCDGICVNLQSDNLNCGECGNACEFDEVCTSGMCCEAGSLACDGECVDVRSDPENCGECGNPCEEGEMCMDGECAAIPVEESCEALLEAAPGIPSGVYEIDPPEGPAVEVYCDMETDGGGWTTCYELNNTPAEEIVCGRDDEWFRRCVDYMSWSGRDVMVMVVDGEGDTVYSAWGTRTNDWSYNNLTSPNSLGSQYNYESYHPNHVRLNTGHWLTVTGEDTNNHGWGGSWGNGYIVAVQTSPAYAMNFVVTAMSIENTGEPHSCGRRSFEGLTFSHELMFSATGGVSTNGGAWLRPEYAMLGTFRFLVR